MPSKIQASLNYIQSVTGVAPTDPLNNSWLSGRLLVGFGYLYYYTNNSFAKQMYDFLKSDMLGDLDRGYLTGNGIYAPSEANQQGVPSFLDLYLKLGDEDLFNVFETVAKGFTGKREDNNWPTTTYSGYTITKNSFKGSEWGTINQHLTSGAVILAGYLYKGSSLYGDDSVLERAYGGLQMAKDKQKSNGCIPRDAGGSCNWTYHIASMFYLEIMWLYMKKYGDVSYNSESLMTKIENIMEKAYQYTREFGNYRVPTYSGNEYPDCVYLVGLEKDGDDEGIRTLIKNEVIAPMTYVEQTGLRWNTTSSNDVRDFALRSAGRCFFAISIYDKYEDLIRRWI